MNVKLVMFKQDGQRKDFGITNKTTVIGRGENCTLRVPLMSISREHCELILSNAELRIRDLASSNGTYVNNQRVNETTLNAGDRLTIGPSTFTVQINGKPEQIEPAKAKPAEASHRTHAEEEILELRSDAESEDSDPIAALESLAADHDEE